MATGVVVGRIFLAAHQLLGVVQLAVDAGANLVDDGRLEVDKDGPWDVLAGASLSEEGAETVVDLAGGLLRRHGAVGLDAVLKAVELPAGIAYTEICLLRLKGVIESINCSTITSRAARHSTSLC